MSNKTPKDLFEKLVKCHDEDVYYKKIFDIYAPYVLSPTEISLLKAYYGFDGCAKTLKEIAKEKSCSTEWVRKRIYRGYIKLNTKNFSEFLVELNTNYKFTCSKQSIKSIKLTQSMYWFLFVLSNLSQIPIDYCKFSKNSNLDIRIYHSIKRTFTSQFKCNANLSALDVILLTEAELQKMRNMGKRSLDALCNFINTIYNPKYMNSCIEDDYLYVLNSIKLHAFKNLSEELFYKYLKQFKELKKYQQDIFYKIYASMDGNPSKLCDDIQEDISLFLE